MAERSKLTLIPTASGQGPVTPLDGNGQPPDDGDMETRVAVLESKIDQLATKDELRASTAELRTDIHKLESTFVKWGVGFAIAIIGAIIGYLNLTRPSAPPSVQPIVIQMQAPPTAPTPAAAPK